MSFVETIARKRDGGALGREEIVRFVVGATDGSLPPEQLAALLMAICCRGLDEREIGHLTEAMLDSGERWRLAETWPEAVDKHSTGGVGDTVSLVFAPLMVAAGTPVAMMAGRGLGHSQGTLDKLEAIPGLSCNRDRAGTLALLESSGAAIVAQSDEIAPADRVLYALRDVTGTVPSLGLIVASILSKKLALGAATLVLDIKWGSGAFRKSIGEAAELGLALRGLAREAGVACEALISDMNQPLGPALGTACEVLAAREVLADAGDPLLRELSLRLAEEALVLGGGERSEARGVLERALADGSALAAWERLVVAHGGDPDPARLPRPHRRLEVGAGRSGFVAAVDGERLGWIAVELGAGRRRRGEELAHGAGLLVAARLGERVERGQPLATILVGEREVEAEALARRVGEAFAIDLDPPPPRPLVLGTVDEV